jgi:serine O-acetyltransferase
MDYDGNTVKVWAGNSEWRALQADFARFRVNGYSAWGSEGFWTLALYRLQRRASRARPRWLWACPLAGLAVLRKLLTMLTHISIDSSAEIGPGLLIPHASPIWINGNSRIGADCAVMNVCTIGAGPQEGLTIVGDHVLIGCNSAIISGVTIGDNATIAAHATVITDVPPETTAFGVPARILPGLRRERLRPAPSR